MKAAILLIEDDQWLAESYRSLLENKYDLTLVSDAASAIEAIDDKQFDLIVADVMLEKGLVIDLLHELQSYNDTQVLPVILCTTLAGSINGEDVRRYGVVAVLDKATMVPSDLRVAIQQVLHEATGR